MRHVILGAAVSPTTVKFANKQIGDNNTGGGGGGGGGEAGEPPLLAAALYIPFLRH